MSGFGRIPGVQSITMDPPLIRLSGFGHGLNKGVVVVNTVRDAGSTPTTRIRPGLVLVKVTATGKYVEADDSSGDRSTAPAKTTTTHVDGNGVIKLVGNHGTISVTTSTGEGTEANNATDLNADTAFKAHYIASSAAGELTITARQTGENEWFYIHADTMATAPFTEGETNAVKGVDADYLVTDSFFEVTDTNNAAADALITANFGGHWKASNLRSLTPAARETLIRKGQTIFG